MGHLSKTGVEGSPPGEADAQDQAAHAGSYGLWHICGRKDIHCGGIAVICSQIRNAAAYCLAF